MPPKSHGESTTRLYRVWAAMKARCYNSATTFYPDYGGRGIFVCDEWHEYVPFRTWAMDNGYSEGLELDRQDNNGPYAPTNCRFIPHEDNCRNRRSNVWLDAFGERKILQDWSLDPRCNVGLDTFRRRIKLGWSTERALIQQTRTGRKHRAAPGSRPRKHQSLAVCGRYVLVDNLTDLPTCEDCLTVPKGK